MVLGPILTLAIVLVMGVVGGRLAKLAGLPSVTGQILVGVAAGHSGLHLLDNETLGQLDLVTDFALAFIATAIGAHLEFDRLRNAGKRIFFLLLTESTITPAVTAGLILTLGGADGELAWLLAAMAISTAPATILAIVLETRSKGVFVKTLIAAVAFNNVACITIFEVVRALTRPESAPVGLPSHAPLIDPFWGLLVALGVGFAVGAALVFATRRGGPPERHAPMSLAALLAVAGLSEMLGVSVMLACLTMGATVANLAPLRQDTLGTSAFRSLEGAIFAAFFTMAGLHLDFSYLIPAGALAGAVLLGRFVGKLLAANVAMRLAGATERVRRNLGLALVPQAGVAVGLILTITADPAFTELADTLLAVGLTTVMLNELIGPLLTRHALGLSGDLGQNRARVIDFINEENIIMGLEAATKEEAIGKLADLMIRSHHLRNVDRHEFVRAVLERERESSTCVGRGVAVPHAMLGEGDQVAGVIGVSRRGLDFDTPDGQPVHVMMLLGTSTSRARRHLEVLGALSRAVSHDKHFGEKLVNARSPAHVYELFHTKEAEDFNFFLDAPVES